jgi:hypothetical protein
MMQDIPMSEHIDPNAGKGGSYEMQPDGTRILLFRTAEACPAVEPAELSSEPTAAPEPAEEDGDAKPQARIKR